MKDSKKMIVGAVLYTLLYIGIIYASLCLGYIHPFFWVYASLVSSVFAGIPYLYLTTRWQKFGVGTLFAFLVAGLCAHGRRDDSKLGIDFVDRNIDGHYSLCNR